LKLSSQHPTDASADAETSSIMRMLMP
jgi:hypothetical protein